MWTADFSTLALNPALGADSSIDVQRLSHYFDQHWPNVRLQLISEQLTSAFPEETACFETIPYQTKCGRVYWVRKIFLRSHDLPLSYARVVVPETTYLRFQSDFDHLKTKPIGETLLHHNPAVIRYPFEYRFLTKDDLLSQDIQAIDSTIKAPGWARRSLFTWSGFPLLITEVFLFQTQVATCP